MKRTKEYYYNVGDIVNGLKIQKLIKIETKDKNKIKGYEVQSVTYPNAPTYEVREGNLKHGRGDAYVSGKKVCDENSLWAIKDIRKYIIDEDEAKNIIQGSNKKVILRCDICKQEKEMSAISIKSYGFSCSTCSTNTSYPERFFQAYLKAKDLQYDYQVKFDDSKRRIDFYVPSLNIYVEVHGIVHYESQNGSAWEGSYERTMKSDEIKRQWCKDNKETLVELDCRKSSFEFISNSINNSPMLPNISKNDIPKIEKFIKNNSNYQTNTIIEMYNSGLSYHSVAEKMGLGAVAVYNILKRSNVKMRNINDTRKKKVKCIETGIVYESVNEASKKVGVNRGNLGRVCRENKGTVGGFHWEYV